MDFPQYSGPKFTKEQVVQTLMKLKSNGYAITQNGATYYIDLGEKELHIQMKREGVWGVMLSPERPHGCANQAEFEQTIYALINHVTGRTDEKPTTAPLIKDSPATNVATIARFIDDTICALHDPYLSNESLATLLDLHGFGCSFNSPLRILTIQGRHTESFLQAFCQETKVTVEVKTIKKAHQRFFILRSGEVVTVGCSTNKLSHQERIFRLSGSDAKVESDFFESEWLSASPKSLHTPII
jgi:hypothetical protein